MADDDQDPAGAGAATADPEPKPEPAPEPAGAAGADDGEPKGGTPAGGDDEELSEKAKAIIARQSGEIARMAKALQGRQAEIGKLRGGAPAATDAEPAAARSEAPPAGTAAGAQPASDEYGNVLFRGSYVSPELADYLTGLEQAVGEARDWKATQEQARQHEQIAEAADEFVDAVAEVITGVRKESFPDLPAEAGQQVDEDLLEVADRLFTRALTKGEEPTPELIERIARDSVAVIRRRFGLYGALQVKTNREHEQTHGKVTPKGEPGLPAETPLHALSRKERKLAHERAAAAAVAAASRE